MDTSLPRTGTGRSRLERLTLNAALNGVGQIVPMALGVAAVPPLLRGLGADRFGLLTLAWTMVGVFTVFDLGLGRAITQGVSRALALGRDEEVGELANTGFASVAILGTAAGVALWFFAPQVASRLRVPPELAGEAVLAVRAVAVGLPAVTLMSGVRSFLESLGAFAAINANRLAVGIGTFGGPLLLVLWTRNVAFHVAFLVAVRYVSLLHQLAVAVRLWPAITTRAARRAERFLSLLRYGGWMTVSNVISPLMVYLDRFLISSLVGLSAVAFYATPVDVLTRVLVIPNALVGALFPLATEQWFKGDVAVRRTYRSALGFLVAVMVPIALVGILAAHPLLRLWVSPDFADRSALVFRVLTLGMAANALAAVPYSLIQAVGRPDLTAKIHLAELVPYLVALTLLVREWGVTGAAVAWSARLVVDAVVLFYTWRHLQRGEGRA